MYTVSVSAHFDHCRVCFLHWLNDSWGWDGYSHGLFTRGKTWYSGEVVRVKSNQTDTTWVDRDDFFLHLGSTVLQASFFIYQFGAHVHSQILLKLGLHSNCMTRTVWTLNIFFFDIVFKKVEHFCVLVASTEDSFCLRSVSLSSFIIPLVSALLQANDSEIN